MCLAVPGEVLATYDRAGLPFAEVRFGAVTREICLQLEPDAAPGDFVLVHVGLAISKIDGERARHALALLSELGELEVEEDSTSRARGAAAPAFLARGERA